MTLPSSVRTALAAWLASILAAATVFPLVQGQGWFVDVALIAALTGGAGLAVRRLTTAAPVVVGVQVAVWLVAVCMIFLNRSAFLGVLPGPEAFGAGQELFGQGLRVMNRAAPPVPATAGVVFVTAAGLSLVALLVDVIAVTVRRPAVAGLPLLAVYCVPAAVLRDGLSWTLFVLAGAGFLLLVAVDSVDRVQAWGRVLSGSGSSGRSSLGMVFAGARRLAGVSLALAVVLPLVLPGIGERALTGRGTGPGRGDGTVTVLNPLLNLRQDLADQSNTPLITYTTTMTTPQPLRVVVDDEFRGDVWQPSTGEVPRDNKVQNGAGLPQGLGPTVPIKDYRTRLKVYDLAQNYLPLPFPWRRVDVDGDWIFDANSQVVVGDGVTTRNSEYEVDHYTVQATPEQLRAAPEPDQAVFDKYTALPDTLPGEIGRVAARQAGDGTAYDQAVQLREWLRSFTYSTQAPGDGSTDSSSDAVLQFLKDKRGYCVHFASAMAVMARTLGIPARVVVGFLPGTRGTDNATWTITLKDAHAWPELYFQGYGWIRFEPTPPAQTAGVPDIVESNGGPGAAPSPSSSASAADPSPSASANSRLPREEQVDDSLAGDISEPSAWDRALTVLRSPWTLGVALVLLALSVPATVLALARRRRWRRAGSRTERAEAALDELGERLSDLGVPLSAARTPRGVREWLVGAEHVPPDRTESLDRLVTELEAARYAPPGGDGPGAHQLRGDVKAVAQVVAEQVPKGRRRLALLLPASGLAMVTGAARRADVAMEGAGERAAGQVGDEVRRLVGRRR